MPFAKHSATTHMGSAMRWLPTMLPVSGPSTLMRGSNKVYIYTYPRTWATHQLLENSILLLIVRSALRRIPWTSYKEQVNKMERSLRPCGHPWTRQQAVPGPWPYLTGKKLLINISLIPIGKKMLTWVRYGMSVHSTWCSYCAVQVNSLKQNFVKALAAIEESLDIFNELDESIDPNIRKDWEEQERLAMKFRGEYLNVYNVNKEKGKFLTPATYHIAYLALQFLEINLVLLLLDQFPAPTIITQPLCGWKLV